MLDNRLAYAVAVARTQSFTKAAEQVGVTQSAVTKGIADLEDQLGYALFSRSARGAELTVEGRVFVERASSLLEDARDLLKPEAKADPYSGALRIGVCPASLEWLLADPLGQLIRDYPSIRVQMTAGSFETIVAQLRAGLIDIAFGFDAAFDQWPELARVPMSVLKVGMFVRRGHPLLDIAVLKIDEIACYPFVGPSDSRPYGEFVRSLYPSYGRDGSANIHIADFFPIVREIVEASDAIGIVSADFRPKGSFADKFQFLPFDLFTPARMCCAYRARWEPKRNVRALLAMLERHFATGSPDHASSE